MPGMGPPGLFPLCCARLADTFPARSEGAITVVHQLPAGLQPSSAMCWRSTVARAAVWFARGRAGHLAPEHAQ
jgi:hypothetical protein